MDSIESTQKDSDVSTCGTAGLESVHYLSVPLIQKSEDMKAIWNNQVIAESDETVVVEGNHYFPKDSVKEEVLEESSTTSVCGWKGLANYYTLNVDGKQNPDAAWYYADPKPDAEQIRGKVAFWKGVIVSE